MRITDTKWAQPAFEVIRDTDPETYARMQDSDWQVYVTDGIDDVFKVLGTSIVGLIESMTIGQHLVQAFAVTLTNVKYDGLPPEALEIARLVDNSTWVNRPDITAAAERDLHVPVPDLLAMIIVHEFRHAEGGDEIQAGHAGIDFARKLGSDVIADMAQKTLLKHLIDSVTALAA